MKKVLSVLAIIVLSLAMAGQVWAGYTVKPKTSVKTGSGLVRTGNTNIKAINFYSATAGDVCGVYNSANVNAVAGELTFELGISANTSSAAITMGTDGVDLSEGCFVSSNSAAAVITVIYDY